MIKVRFAFYWFIEADLRPEPSYFIDESDIPELPRHGNVCYEQLRDKGVNIPFTPTYDTWLKMGSPIYRGEVSARS